MASSPITSWQMCSAKLLQLCPTLRNPMDCSLPGSSVHGIFQARILRWVSISSSRESSQDGRELNPRLLCLPPLVGRFFTTSITLWQIEQGKMEAVTDFIFLGSRITVDGDCSHEVKIHLLLGRKAMTNLDSILKAEISLYRQRSIQSKVWVFQYSCMDVIVGL